MTLEKSIENIRITKKSMKNLSLLLVLLFVMGVVLGASCNKEVNSETNNTNTTDTANNDNGSPIPEKPNKVPVIPNKSKAKVYVMAITQKEYPEVKFNFKVMPPIEKVNEEASFLKGGEEINVNPLYVRKSGRLGNGVRAAFAEAIPGRFRTCRTGRSQAGPHMRE